MSFSGKALVGPSAQSKVAAPARFAPMVRGVERSSGKPAKVLGDLFASHDAASLCAWLEARGETPPAARMAAGKAIRHVHGGSLHAAWNDEALAALGINRRARGALL